MGDARPALLLLFGAVGLLLLIACANVGNLMLARAAAREREIAIRAALGAGSGRIFRQVLTESALLVAAAAVAGLVAAALGSRGLLALLPADLRIPQLADVRLDASVVAFTALLALLAGLVFGLVPVLGTWTPRLMEGLREGRSEAGSGRRRGLRSGLVVAEIALALVLAAGAGLLFRSFLELRRVDTGLELDSVLTARLTLPRGRYGEPAARAAFFRQARERVAALPGVESVSAIQWPALRHRLLRGGPTASGARRRAGDRRARRHARLLRDGGHTAPRRPRDRRARPRRGAGGGGDQRDPGAPLLARGGPGRPPPVLRLGRLGVGRGDRRRLNLWLFGAFALLALTLAAVGAYGVISYTVAQRTREIGIRMALGAERGAVAALVVRHGLGLAALGAAVGLGGVLALTRLMESLLFGVGTADPLTFAAAPLVLIAVAAVACLVPARRASRVDPTVTLRYE